MSNNLRKLAIKFGLKQLRASGYFLKNEHPEVVQDTPWSYVIRFNTSCGYVYLKQTPQKLGLEPNIIKTLFDRFDFSVPEVIEVNEDLSCFLMKDAGESLRSILKVKFNEYLLVKAIDKFCALQRSVVNQWHSVK